MLQNQEVFNLVLNQNKVILIPCLDEKDAHSKRVSLHRSRAKLPKELHLQLQVHKVFIQSTWMVQVKKTSSSYLELTPAGEIIPLTLNYSLTPAGQTLFEEMQSLGTSPEDILTILLDKGEKKDAIQQALLSYSQ